MTFKMLAFKGHYILQEGFDLVVHQLFHFTDWTGSRETLIAVGNAIRAFPPAQIPLGARGAVGAAELNGDVQLYDIRPSG